MTADESPSPTGEQIRVFLLDDHEIVRRGVADLIDAEDDLVVVGQWGGAVGAVEQIEASRPDVVVIDVRLGDGSGIEVCRDIRSSQPDIGCLILTSFSDDQALVDASLAGAAGYLLKQVRGNRIVEAIRAVAGGAQLLDSATVRLALRRLRESEPGTIAELTPREPRDPRPDRRGSFEPSDRDRAVPRREDGQELRVEPARQARHAAPLRSGRLRRPRRRTRPPPLRVARKPRTCLLETSRRAV